MRVDREKAKKEAYDNKLMEDFERDKQRRQLVAAKGDEAANLEQAQERIIVEKIIYTEGNF